MLSVVKLAKSFSGFQAVAEVNLTVPKGEVTAVIGPNGAGKSTLFNLIMGNLKPSGGHIMFKGSEISGLPPYRVCRLGISQSFQLVNLFHTLSVFENVHVAALARQRLTYRMLSNAQKHARAKTLAILEKTRLIHHAEKSCQSLSYGDQKLLEIAISLASKPELLLLDEPTAGMAPDETKVIVDLIRALCQTEGLTVLLTEHDMDVVFGLAQRIMVMHQGRTIAEGSPDEIRTDRTVQDAYLGETLAC